jgi:hypothetical protein
MQQQEELVEVHRRGDSRPTSPASRRNFNDILDRIQDLGHGPRNEFGSKSNILRDILRLAINPDLKTTERKALCRALDEVPQSRMADLFAIRSETNVGEESSTLPRVRAPCPERYDGGECLTSSALKSFRDQWCNGGMLHHDLPAHELSSKVKELLSLVTLVAETHRLGRAAIGQLILLNMTGRLKDFFTNYLNGIKDTSNVTVAEIYSIIIKHTHVYEGRRSIELKLTKLLNQSTIDNVPAWASELFNLCHHLHSRSPPAVKYQAALTAVVDRLMNFTSERLPHTFPQLDKQIAAIQQQYEEEPTEVLNRKIYNILVNHLKENSSSINDHKPNQQRRFAQAVDLQSENYDQLDAISMKEQKQRSASGMDNPGMALSPFSKPRYLPGPPQLIDNKPRDPANFGSKIRDFATNIGRRPYGLPKITDEQWETLKSRCLLCGKQGHYSASCSKYPNQKWAKQPCSLCLKRNIILLHTECHEGRDQSGRDQGRPNRAPNQRKNHSSN